MQEQNKTAARLYWVRLFQEPVTIKIKAQYNPFTLFFPSGDKKTGP